jgi:predicted nucleic acid-binding protein
LSAPLFIFKKARQIDGLLAVMPLEHGMTLVTRNVRDVKRSGVLLPQSIFAIIIQLIPLRQMH